MPGPQAGMLVMFVQRGDDRARHFTNLDLAVRMVQQAFKLRTRCTCCSPAAREESQLPMPRLVV